jgi:TolB-like protein/Flp pilus assembly protein TadD
VSPQLEAIIRKCLEKDPTRRYQSVAELLIDFRNLKRDAQSGVSPARVGFPKHSHWKLVAILLFVAVIGAILFYLKNGTSQSQAITSIAVLPFANTSGDSSLDYLSDGITENIINRLSQISSLKVMARSTVFHFKSKDIDPQKAGKELKVRAVLTGTVTQFGDSLVVGTELVDVEDGSQLWGQQYSKKFADLLALQQQISEEISDRLRLKLSKEQKESLKKNETSNPEAFQLYLKGLYYWNKRSDAGIRKGIEYFQQSIEKDPNYAMAYVGLADSYDILPLFSFAEPNEVVPKGKAAAYKALQIDEKNAEAHASLGNALQLYDWNFPESEKEYKRAISLNPNYATAHHFYSELLVALNRNEEAIDEIKRALNLDPLSLIINTSLGNTYRRTGKTDLAKEEFKKTIELDPSFARVHYNFAMAYMDIGQFSNAIREMETYISHADYGQAYLGDLACLYSLTSRKEEALKLIDQLKDLSKTKYIPSTQLASAYAGLGEKDQAFQWLEAAVRNRDPALLNVHKKPFFNSLHSDPRYHDLLRRIGLEK